MTIIDPCNMRPRPAPNPNGTRARQVRARARVLPYLRALEAFLAAWDSLFSPWSWAIVTLDPDPLMPAQTVYGYAKRDGEYVTVIALGGPLPLKFRASMVSAHRTTVDEVERAWVAAGCPRPACCNMPRSGAEGWCAVCGFERRIHRPWPFEASVRNDADEIGAGRGR